MKVERVNMVSAAKRIRFQRERHQRRAEMLDRWMRHYEYTDLIKRLADPHLSPAWQRPGTTSSN